MLDCCKVSVDTKSEECYILFCSMNIFDEHELFNLEYQIIMTEIFILFENIIAAINFSGNIVMRSLIVILLIQFCK